MPTATAVPATQDDESHGNEYDLLTIEEERELSALVQQGLSAAKQLEAANQGAVTLLPAARQTLERQVAEGQAARTRFITANLGLVRTFAKRYRRKNKEREDLEQEGRIGLMTAVEKFDGTRGWKFSTYAAAWIKQRMIRCMEKESSVTLPPSISRQVKQYWDTVDTLRRQLNREPTEQEICEASGLSHAQFSQTLPATWGADHLDRMVGYDSQTTLGDTIADDTSSPIDATVQSMVIGETLERKLGVLTEPERELLIHHYSQDPNQPTDLDKTSERILRRALGKLRHPCTSDLGCVEDLRDV